MMTTGSRFFRAPPYCGAVFVPKSIMEKLYRIDRELAEFNAKDLMFIQELSMFLGQNEIPKELETLRSMI